MAEISYYPLSKDKYKEIIGNVIHSFSEFNLKITYTEMSTIVIGKHGEVLKLIEFIIMNHFPENPSILEVKFSNACF